MGRLIYLFVIILTLAVLTPGCTKTLMEEAEDAHRKISSADSANCEQVASVMDKLPKLISAGVTEDQLVGFIEPMKQFCPESQTIAHNVIKRAQKNGYTESEIHFVAYIECAKVINTKN